jgi:transcriptional regulator with XRE-family HTH domain
MKRSKRTDPVDLALRRAVGDAIRTLRENRKPVKFAQENLALEAGLNRGYLSGLERGIHDPGLWTLWRLKTALNISLCRLVREICDHYKPPSSRHK